MKPDTWMPFYVGDYLRDTSRLTTEGHGAYLLLIFDYWVAGKPLPDDNNQLAAVARLPLSRWKALRPTLEQFFQIDGGLWRHKRIDAELVKATESIAKRSAAGTTGATARWGNRNANANGNRMAIASEPDGDSIADANASSPSPIVSSLRSETNAREARSALRAEFAEWWKEYPHKVAKADAERKYEKARKLASAEALLDGLRRYKVNKPPDISWCNPGVWLHNKRWEDEPAYVAKLNGSSSPDHVTVFWDGFPDPARIRREAEWAARLQAWAEKPHGYWAFRWGPRPDQADCEAPPSMRDWAVRRAVKHNMEMEFDNA